MTLKGHYTLCFKTRASFGAHHENLNEDRLHYQRRRCRPMTLDSGNIKVCADNRGGSQDLCKFSLHLVPTPVYMTYTRTSRFFVIVIVYYSYLPMAAAAK